MTMSTSLVPVEKGGGLMARIASALGRGADTKGAMVHPGGSGMNWLFPLIGSGGLLPATTVDYDAEVGDGSGSSVLAGPLNFLARTFPEAPPIVEKLDGESWKKDPTHPMLRLLRRPNPFYSGRDMLKATVRDYAFGNAFWYKVRNVMDEVVQLWWLPRFMVNPHVPSDHGATFIDYYEYNPGVGGVKRIEPRDIVHFRNGLDPKNVRLGLSDLGALMREVGVDDQAANFMGSILRNKAIIGLVVSPKEKGQKATPEAIKETKDYLKRMFTGDKRGEALVHGAPIDVQLLQYQMQNFDVSWIRDVSEERVCAALGLPAAVVGFGTGLQQTKVGATMKEMRQLAWTGCIMPNQDSVADEIDRSLMPEFEPGKKENLAVRMRFDTSTVRALWEDSNEKHTRVREDFKAKMIDRHTALRETGRPASDADKGVYFAGAPAPASPDPEPKPPKPQDEE